MGNDRLYLSLYNRIDKGVIFSYRVASLLALLCCENHILRLSTITNNGLRSGGKHEKIHC